MKAGFRTLGVIVLVVLLLAILVSTVQAASVPTTYQPFSAQPVYAEPSTDSEQVGTVWADDTYKVVQYDWQASNIDNWALIEYAPRCRGWVRVTHEFETYGQVVHRLGVVYPH